MMRMDDAMLMAYADGELPPFEAKRIEAAMAEDAALAARVARFRSVRRALRTAYDSVAAEPVPEHLRALLGDVAGAELMAPQPPSPAVDLAERREEHAAPKLALSPPAWAAVAASLLVGLLAGRAFPSQQGPFAGDASHLYAGASLARALDNQLASDPQNAATRIGVTFRDHDGAICRTFVQARTVSGLACRDGRHWAVRATVASQREDGAYRQAAPPAIMTIVDQMIQGEAFDAGQERSARDHSWLR